MTETETKEFTRVLAHHQGFVVFGTFRPDKEKGVSAAHTPELHVLSLGPGLVDACTVEWGEPDDLHRQTFPLFTKFGPGETAVCASGPILGEWSKQADDLKHDVSALSGHGDQITLTIHAIGSAGRSDLSVQPTMYWFAHGRNWEDRHFAFDLSLSRSGAAHGDL